mgnify:CR=1 FL=1
MEKKQNGNQMKRNIIIAAVALAVVAVLVVILVLLPEPAEKPDPSASPSETITPIETHYLVNEQFTKLDSITLYDADGAKVHTITTASKDDGSIEYSIAPSREGWNYDTDTFRSTAVNASTLSALSLVAENPTDLSQYGLDKPTWKIVTSFDSGARKYELLVGAPTALNNSYYCANGDGNVYAVGAYGIGTLTRDEMSYRTYAFFPSYYDQDAMEVNTDGAITFVRALDPSAGYDLQVRKIEEGEFENPATQMYMDAPIETFVSEDQAENKLINVAVLITVNGIYIDDPTDEQLAECGLDNPKEVWLKNEDGDEVHYYIGNIVGSNAYVMVDGVDTVLTAEGVYTALFELKYTDIMFKMLLRDNVREVSRVEYDLPDGTHRTLELSYAEPTGDEVAGTVSGSLDGTPISSTNASRLYAATLGVNIYEAYEKGSITLPRTPTVKVEVTRNDGGTTTLELYAINERRYAVALDGEETGFYVHRDLVNTMINAFGYVDRGETIPRVQ